MINLQTAVDLQKVIATNDATTIGVLIAINVAFGVAIVYLFKQNQEIHKDYISKLIASNEALSKVTVVCNEIVKNVIDLRNGK